MSRTDMALRYLGWILPCAFLALGLIVDRSISVTFFLTGALGIAVMWRYRLLSSISREEKWFAAAFFVFMGVSLFAALVPWRIHPRTLQELEACARYLLAVPIFLLVKWARPPAALIWGSAMAGAALAGLYGLHHMLTLGPDEAAFVSGGVRHHIRFGVGSVTLGFIGLTAFGWLYRRKRLLSLVPVIAALLGLLGGIASGSRTSWLAVPALLCIALFMSASAVPLRLRAGLAAAAVAAAAVLWLVPQTGVASRVQVGLENIRQYKSERGHIASVGARFEMWKAAALIVRENPVMGVGVAGYSGAVADLVEEGHIRPTTERYLDPHNEYLAVASSRGALGLLALALLLGIPGALFLRRAGSADEEVKALASAGLMVVVGFAFYGLTHTLSVRTFYITFFTMLVAVFYGMVRGRLQSSGNS